MCRRVPFALSPFGTSSLFVRRKEPSDDASKPDHSGRASHAARFQLRAPAGVALAQDTPKTKEGQGPGTNVVWIYRNGEGDRTPSELYFGSGPTYFSPAAKATDISLNSAFSVADFGNGGEGTCIELIFTLNNASDWASAGFIPGGSIGPRPAYNVAEHLAPELGRPVFLRFRARTKAGEKAKVKFTSGNFARSVEGWSPTRSEAGTTYATHRRPLDVGRDRPDTEGGGPGERRRPSSDHRGSRSQSWQARNHCLRR